jgi:hypothetical protein
VLGTDEKWKSAFALQLSPQRARGVVEAACVAVAKRLARRCDAVKLPLPGLEEAARRVAALTSDSRVSQDVARDASALWRDEGVQRLLALPGEAALSAACARLFPRLDAVAAPDYVPTARELLCARGAHGAQVFEGEAKLGDKGVVLCDVVGRGPRREVGCGAARSRAAGADSCARAEAL